VLRDELAVEPGRGRYELSAGDREVVKLLHQVTNLRPSLISL
jgi:hypothetical protein